jgi:hypothetical protein|tara:strand:- start:3472 stop:3588 length:117 start_codon:yes stop_codon:yes gene_type:complete
MADRILPPPRPISRDEALALGMAAALATIHTILRRDRL